MNKNARPMVASTLRRTIITILLALVAMTGQAQEIKKVAATPEDFMEHMALCGYEVYTYDISSLRGFRTKTMISDFNEKDQQEIYAENDADDMDRGIYRLAKILAVGFSPVQSDSIETITLRSSRNDASPWELTLKPIPGAPQTIYRYQKAPYQPTSFSLDTFIPLVFYGSFWWDEQAKGWRFCGETELTRDRTDRGESQDQRLLQILPTLLYHWRSIPQIK